MNAVEFQTTVHKGVITLPSHLQSWNGKKVRVILLEQASADESEITTNETLEFIQKLPIGKRSDTENTKNFQALRDEWNQS
jgi:hypothetical protein